MNRRLPASSFESAALEPGNRKHDRERPRGLYIGVLSPGPTSARSPVVVSRSELEPSRLDAENPLMRPIMVPQSTDVIGRPVVYGGKGLVEEG
jgi:hypothetical protein